MQCIGWDFRISVVFGSKCESLLYLAEEHSEIAETMLEAPTVPDEDFFNLIQKLQSSRLEDQRASLNQK